MRLLAQLKLDKPPRIARVFHRSNPYARPTTHRVDLVPKTNVSRLQYVLPTFKQALNRVALLQVELELLLDIEQHQSYRYEITHN